MSQLVLWGTGLPVSTLRRRITSEGDLRVTSQGDTRVASIPALQVKFIRVTSEGDTRVTSDGSRRVTIDGLQGPQYFQTANVTTDGGEAFAFSYTSNPWQPSAQGGENVWYWAYITVSWSMLATIRVGGIVDGDDQPVFLEDGSSIEPVRSTFQLDQQTGTLQRKSAVFAIPLVRRYLIDGVEQMRQALRGERLQLVIESTGPLGVGELLVEGAEIEYTAVRKAIYTTVDSTPN